MQNSYALVVPTIFDVTTTEHIYAIGHPIDIVFETHNHKQSLSTLNLDILNKNFVIHDYNIDKVEDIIGGETIRIENLVVRLYPKRSGTLVIPAFKLGQYKSKLISLSIINDFNSAIQIRTSTLKDKYYQREPINIYVDVFYRRKKITSSVGEIKNKDFIISDVVKTEYTITDNGLKLPVDRFSWIIIPLTEGEHIIKLPMVKTGGRRMYPSGKLELTVSPLPSTLPALAPVSKQIISSNYLTKSKFWINKVYYWKLSVTGNGLNENILDKIIATQLESNANIRYFPRSYERARINNGAEFKTDIKIPFKLYKTGDFQFPVIDIPYIDPTSGLIEHTYSSKLSLSATSQLNETLKVILALILLILVLTQPILNLIKRSYIKYRFRMCYYAMVITSNPKRLKKTLFNLSPRFETGTISSIKHWEETVAVARPEDRQILVKISSLMNNFNYGKRYSKNEISVLKRLVKKLI